MHWIWLSLLSAIILGLYGIAKKKAVDGNPVPPVLMLQVATSAAIWLPSILFSAVYPDAAADLVAGSQFQVQPICWQQHLMLALKSLLVASSWLLALYGVKHLPISVSAPIRATSPVWTILVAVSILDERPDALQWGGIGVVLLAFFLLSRASRREGIEFTANRAIAAMVAATLLGSASALYDKHLLQRFHFTAATVQAWFSVYLTVVMTPVCVWWYVRDRHKHPLVMRRSIFAVALALLLADFCYFQALTDPRAMISVISPLRRASVVIPFAYGILFLEERNGRQKAACVAMLLVGVAMLSVR